jgi:cysteinyl-tRNA synthetase, unknown class
MYRFTILITMFLLFISSCGKSDNTSIISGNLDYKQKMREFVIGISDYAKGIIPRFAIIPQNGVELVTTTGEESGTPDADYLDAIDGNGQEDLFYGYNNDNEITPASENEYLRVFLDISKNAGNTILVTDYCSTTSKMSDSYNQNHANGYISFSADQRDLNNIPQYPDPIYAENNNNITTLQQAKNFLYLINPENFSSKEDFINSIIATNYDLLIMDLFFEDGTEFTSSQINQLKNKKNGGSRLVICYLSIGEAENYRYYWDNNWSNNPPQWLDKENPDWSGNYKVKYWDSDWQRIIYGSDDSYLKKIMDAGFDGVYLDIVDAFEYYE